MVRRSSGGPNTTSVDTTKLGRRTEWTWVAADVGAARLARPVELLDRQRRYRGRADLPQPLGQLARRPLGTSGLVALA